MKKGISAGKSDYLEFNDIHIDTLWELYTAFRDRYGILLNIKLWVFNTTFQNISVIFTCILGLYGLDRMLGGFTTIYAISAYHH